MSTRRALTVAVFAVAVVAVFKLWPPGPRGEGAPQAPPAPAGESRPVPASAAAPRNEAGDLGKTVTAAPAAVAARVVSGAIAVEDFPIVAPLNQAGSTLARDLATVAAVLDAWRTNFPREGNPVGENADITAGLSGANPLGLVLIPKQHPAINAQGELCDRWGTPFRFHQLSGEHMEIRSAGPDRKFATEDDGRWQPLPGAP
jgi:hypothetical protein